MSKLIYEEELERLEETLERLEKENEMLKEQNHIYNLDNIQLRQDNKVIVNGVDVIELIERDTPKKPLVNIGNVIRQYNCGVCVCRLDIPQLREVNFCPKCGQRIDWSE